MIDNTVIEVLDREHGKKVIEFFKSKGVDTRDLEGVFCKADSNLARFYGVVDGRFDHWPAFSLKGVKIITLPEYPKVMEVSDNEDFRESLKRVVFMEKKDRFLAWDGATTLEEAEDSIEVIPWLYARDIQPKPDTMTKEKEIREWLEELPDGYRERALKNYYGLPARSLPYAILNAFTWRDTPEKHKFWNAVADWAF